MVETAFSFLHEVHHAGIRIQTQPNLDTFIRNIERLSENLTDGFDWESLAPMVAEAADRIFASEGRGAWPQLSEAYARWKEQETIRAKVFLELTGAYRSAATQIGSPHNLVEVGPDHLTYGVEGLDYPVFHESGTDRLPARPVFDLLAEDEDLSSEVKEALSEHINQKLSEAQIARQ